MPEGTGVLLNDIMSGFAEGEGRNQIGPGKRPVSSMTPTILLASRQHAVDCAGFARIVNDTQHRDASNREPD